MNEIKAKQLLKSGGKNIGEIKAIYERHIDALGFSYSDAQWNRAISIALAEAGSIACSFSLNGNAANAVAELMDT